LSNFHIFKRFVENAITKNCYIIKLDAKLSNRKTHSSTIKL